MHCTGRSSDVDMEEKIHVTYHEKSGPVEVDATVDRPTEEEIQKMRDMFDDVKQLFLD